MSRLTGYLKPFSAMIAGALLSVFLQAWAELSLPSFMADIVDKGIVTGNTQLIWRIGGRMLLMSLGGALVAVAGGYLSAKVSTGYGKSLRSAVFSHVEDFSLREFDEIGTASLITRTTNDITQVQMVVLMSLNMVVRAPMMFIGGVIMTVSRDPRLSVTLIAILPVLLAAIIFVTSKVMPLFRAIQAKLDKLNLVLREGLMGIRVVRAFNRTEHEARRFDDANKDLSLTLLRVHRIMSALMPLMMLTVNFMAVVLIWIGSHRIDAGLLEVGGLMAFIQYAMHILMSLMMVSAIFVMFPRASASAERIVQVLDSKSLILDGASPAEAGPAEGRVEFRDVAFSYPGAFSPAVSGLTFVAEPGQVTAILGGTGSGKSTLINLIPRFYEVDSGQILVDGVDVREIPQEKLRAGIGLVPQKAVLFTGTVADNIRFGKEDATEDELVRAAQVAQALSFIQGLDNGFDSLVAQGGTNFSGGQKQRISIARALVRKPQILIFDDSFSALDYRTDANLRKALREKAGGSTVLVVAQRVSTVMDADRIIVLEEGRMVGSGTHRELLETCKVYREIVLSQLSEEEVA